MGRLKPTDRSSSGPSPPLRSAPGGESRGIDRGHRPGRSGRRPVIILAAVHGAGMVTARLGPASTRSRRPRQPQPLDPALSGSRSVTRLLSASSGPADRISRRRSQRRKTPGRSAPRGQARPNRWSNARSSQARDLRPYPFGRSTRSTKQSWDACLKRSSGLSDNRPPSSSIDPVRCADPWLLFVATDLQFVGFDRIPEAGLRVGPCSR
jgi:hypothetical protein